MALGKSDDAEPYFHGAHDEITDTFGEIDARVREINRYLAE